MISVDVGSMFLFFSSLSMSDSNTSVKIIWALSNIHSR